MLCTCMPPPKVLAGAVSDNVYQQNSFPSSLTYITSVWFTLNLILYIVTHLTSFIYKTLITSFLWEVWEIQDCQSLKK